ncbi:DEKNAAC102797 [Brettanomyces naardenensis]|uniref:DEKNAAC102797 n=1 Tax=Brettanomyces naardenensis TaxID=13370 RepID=A0A448YK60_BRENA|nr:DEKNAAC102797 [Brettanomyces naardenensis]
MLDPEILKDLKELDKTSRRSNLSVRNRLLSIIHDNSYLLQLKDRLFSGFDVPFVPNERCGTWYVNPSDYPTTCYFKSTDGHTGEWHFSTRRLNFHLLPLIAEKDSIAIVDSTRSGKRMPDSLSKTIPIWCAIIGKCIRPTLSWDELLFVPDYVVSEIERDQILKRLPSLYEKFLELDIPLPDSVSRPLMPIWLQQKHRNLVDISDVAGMLSPDQPFQPIFLVTASKSCQDGHDKMEGYTYVQGAADDHESWSCGLDAKLFWDNIQTFNAEDDTETVDKISQLVSGKTISPSQKSPQASFWDPSDLTEITSQLYVGKLMATPIELSDKWTSSQCELVVALDDEVYFKGSESTSQCSVYPLRSNTKKSSRELRARLPEIIRVIQSVLYRNNSARILILCRTGEDLSIGVLLACLCLFYDQGWCKRLIVNGKTAIDKKDIRRHLARIIEKRRVNPSRATLNSVHYFLMSNN